MSVFNKESLEFIKKLQAEHQLVAKRYIEFFESALKSKDAALTEKIHALNAFNLDQSFTITKRELMEKLTK